jgi:hypothetical protein
LSFSVTTLRVFPFITFRRRMSFTNSRSTDAHHLRALGLIHTTLIMFASLCIDSPPYSLVHAFLCRPMIWYFILFWYYRGVL